MKTTYSEITKLLENIDVNLYAKNRNFIDGSVTRLSPYISRGILSTKEVFFALLQKNINPKKIEKFIQELAWRDYWQIVWKNKNINEDIKRKQEDVENIGTPKNIIQASTGVNVIDNAINDLYDTGYVHNHIRMYIASIICNIGKCHWKAPAKWFYFHLIDGDWGSNALSWQWVCGTNSSKKYIANQENINKFCYDNQKNTFLDKSYADLYKCLIPKELEKVSSLNLKTKLPSNNNVSIDQKKPIMIYNYYNLDPNWRKKLNANRVLLLEPSTFKDYPISENVFNFFIKLSKNIKNIKIVVSEYKEFYKKFENCTIYYKEHPLNNYYNGICDKRDWLFTNQNYYPSFFKFWNASKKELNI